MVHILFLLCIQQARPSKNLYINLCRSLVSPGRPTSHSWPPYKRYAYAGHKECSSVLFQHTTLSQWLYNASLRIVHSYVDKQTTHKTAHIPMRRTARSGNTDLVIISVAGWVKHAMIFASFITSQIGWRLYNLTRKRFFLPASGGLAGVNFKLLLWVTIVTVRGSVCW